MDDLATVPVDCRSCAACCFSESVRHARVTGADYERIGEDVESLVTWLGNEAFMRLAGGTHGTSSPLHCIALTANLTTGVFGCSIYERRPQVCRDVERGQSACRFELETKGDRPPRSLALARKYVDASTRATVIR